MFDKLKQNTDRINNSKIIDFFKKEPNRLKKFIKNTSELTVDFSKQKLDQAVLDELINLANSCELKEKIKLFMQGGYKANHMSLRKEEKTENIKKILNKKYEFVEKVEKEGKIKDIISLGIGGSELGPLMAVKALEKYKTTKLNLHFVSNVDGNTLSSVLDKTNPESTLVLVNSKTFSTIETMQNAKTVKQWLGEYTKSNLIAVTANVARAKDFGISDNNIFEFWDFVGGRYSLWSAVGLSLLFYIGKDNFEEFLLGASEIDNHFLKEELEDNIPVLMGLIGIWNINCLDYNSLAIKPYLDSLKYLPNYLQQLEMESNGKASDVQTSPIIWGGVGCNGQHAYMQLLHQGTQIVPVDFILPLQGDSKFQEQQDLLVASCLGQSSALMLGNTHKETSLDKICKGNRPSTTIIFKKLTPKTLGSLIALYEHKVFVQGIIWGINSFDQWGVELGKTLINDILPKIKNKSLDGVDPSTKYLLKRYLD